MSLDRPDQINSAITVKIPTVSSAREAIAAHWAIAPDRSDFNARRIWIEERDMLVFLLDLAEANPGWVEVPVPDAPHEQPTRLKPPRAPRNWRKNIGNPPGRPRTADTSEKRRNADRDRKRRAA